MSTCQKPVKLSLIIFMEKCVFCEIISRNKKNETQFISESKHSFIILGNPSLTKGHLLIIPKKHVEKISELKNFEKKDLFNEIEKFQELLPQKFSGCDIHQNYRPFLLQGRLKVDHLHFHIIPREFKDKIWKNYGKFQDKIFKDLNNKKLNETRNEIRSLF